MGTAKCCSSNCLGAGKSAITSVAAQEQISLTTFIDSLKAKSDDHQCNVSLDRCLTEDLDESRTAGRAEAIGVKRYGQQCCSCGLTFELTGLQRQAPQAELRRCTMCLSTGLRRLPQRVRLSEGLGLATGAQTRSCH